MNFLSKTPLIAAAAIAAALLSPAQAQFADATSSTGGTTTVTYCRSVDNVSYETTQWFRDAAHVQSETGKTVASQNGGNCCSTGNVLSGGSCVPAVPTCTSSETYDPATNSCVTPGIDQTACANNFGTWSSTDNSCAFDLYIAGVYNHSVSTSENSFDVARNETRVFRYRNAKVLASYGGRSNVLDFRSATAATVQGRLAYDAAGDVPQEFRVEYGNGQQVRLASGPLLQSMALGTPSSASQTWLNSNGCRFLATPTASSYPSNANYLGTGPTIWGGTSGVSPADFVTYARFFSNPGGAAPYGYANGVAVLCQIGSPTPVLMRVINN